MKECYDKLHSDQPEYIALRSKMYTEVAMYREYIFPKTVRFVESLKDIVEVYIEIENDSEFAEALKPHLLDIRKAREEGDDLRLRHSFVLGNLDALEGIGILQKAKFTLASSTANTIADTTAIGAVGAAAVGTGSVVVGTVVAETTATVVVTTAAAAGTTSVFSLSTIASTFGLEAFFASAAPAIAPTIIVSAPVIWPFFAVAAAVGAIAIGLAATSAASTATAAQLKAAALSLGSLLDSVKGFSEIIGSGTTLLYNMAQDLSTIEKHGDKLCVGLYLRIVKAKVGNVLSLCNKFLELQMQYERTLNSIDEKVQPDRRVDWERRLEMELRKRENGE